MATTERRPPQYRTGAGDDDAAALAAAEASQTRGIRFDQANEEANRVADLIDAALGIDKDSKLTQQAPWLVAIIDNEQVHKALGWAFVIFSQYIFPFSAKAWSIAVRVHATTEVELLNAGYGLALAFFGGYFAVTIAAIEAAKMSGWETTLRALKDLHYNYNLALEAHKKDNKEDLDMDGIADVNQITKQQLLERKMKVFAKAIDPEKCSSALVGLWTAWLSVMTTLKFRYAKTVALGASLGQMMRDPAMEVAVPVLVKALPPQYYKWINVIVGYSIKSIGITIAWAIQSIQSAFQSAIKGGLLFATAIIQFAKAKGKVPENMDLEKLKVKEIIGGTIALLGFMWQMSNGLALPFPVNILLIPLRILEWFLRWQVSSFVVPDGEVAR